MNPIKTNNTTVAWISFIGLILLLIGIYGSARTILNLALFPKYPTAGAISLNLSGFSSYSGPREEDCMYMSPPPMGESPLFMENQKLSCISSVKASQEQAKMNDISQSALFLFLGIGILKSRKYLFS